MKTLRTLIIAIVFILGAFISYGLFTMPRVEDLTSDKFSATRVLNDIRIISQKHHSVAHTENRAEVREYISNRLVDLGGSISTYQYENIEARGYNFDAVNVVAEFAPTKALSDTTWLMMIAHYDSRYAHKFQQDTVWSYGAADDGYGIGVILESVSQALKYRDNWNQGIKVVFTDAEEVGMEGMKHLWTENKEVFDNVGFIINLEARGPMGPCLLFETGSGNEKIMDLYAQTVQHPYTYSLTTVVYSFMPNFTDFKVVKDDMPGMNFSSIVDINRYHTHLDNFSNVNAKTIQHYGAQIVPLMEEYLCGEEYSDPDYLRADNDTINFSIPLLGLLNFSSTQYLIVNITIFILLLLVLGFDILRGNIKFGKVCLQALYSLLLGLGVFATGEFVAFACAMISGVEFKPFGIVQGIMYDNTIMIIAISILFVAYLICYLINRSKATRGGFVSMRSSSIERALYSYSHSKLYGVLLLSTIMSIILLIAIGENLMFLIPLGFATLALMLWHISGVKIFLPAAIFCILLHSYSFLYALSMALTIGAFGAVAMFAFWDIVIVISLSDLYLTERRRR